MPKCTTINKEHILSGWYILIGIYLIQFNLKNKLVDTISTHKF
jgi:hypothetical protein